MPRGLLRYHFDTLGNILLTFNRKCWCGLILAVDFHYILTVGFYCILNYNSLPNKNYFLHLGFQN